MKIKKLIKALELFLFPTIEGTKSIDDMDVYVNGERIERRYLKHWDDQVEFWNFNADKLAINIIIKKVEE